MTQRPEHSEPWRPELLAGLVDGELSPAERSAVEAWLDAHPDGRAEVEAQRSLARQNVVFWKRVAAPQPGESAWAEVLGRVRERLRPATPAVIYREPAAPRRRGRWMTWAAGLATAAALAFASWSLLVPPGGGPRTGEPVLTSTDAFAVATDDEVDIESLQGDGALVVVGRPPLGGPVELVTVGDVVFEAIASDTDLQPSKPTGERTDPKRPLLLPPIDKGTPVPVP
jgi:anti-sigma factor RsiW